MFEFGFVHFNNATNSRKSLLSGIGVSEVAEIDHYLNSLFRRERGIETGVSFVGFRETVEDLDYLLHA